MYEIRASRDIKKDNTQAPAMHGLIMKGLHHRAAQRIIGREGETATFFYVVRRTQAVLMEVSPHVISAVRFLLNVCEDV